MRKPAITFGLDGEATLEDLNLDEISEDYPELVNVIKQQHEEKEYE